MAAPLDNPFYYLENFQHALDWIGERYADLLIQPEQQFLASFAALPQVSRALLVRMIMRKGNAFRSHKLRYAEIGNIREAMAPLMRLGWVEAAPQIDLTRVFEHLTKAEIVTIFSAQIRACSASKSQLLADLLPLYPDVKTLAAWTHSVEPLYTLRVRDICDRVRLLYFGNLHQDWTEFVLAELGLFQYETIALLPGSRAFRERLDLEHYFLLHRCREHFDNDTAAIEDLVATIDAVTSNNEWINARRAKLLFQIAQHCERSDILPLADNLYARCGYAGARARRIRVLERLDQWHAAFVLAQEAIAAPESAVEWQQVQRALPRLAKKSGAPKTVRVIPPSFERIELALPPPPTSDAVAIDRVETCVQRYFSTPDAPVYYVENTLINSLFGLLCWDIIFAPLPGAFFHPFHTGPADLLHPEFRNRRADLFAERFAQLDSGVYRTTIHHFYRAKQGVLSPFVHWGALDDTLLQHALDCLPPTHLRQWFLRLLEDIRTNRTGMPDLIQFWPQQKRYRMVEVKGPGDRLQDNQLRWIEFCARHAMPVSVCFVQWQVAA